MPVVTPEPFHIHIPDEKLDRLRQRLDGMQWPGDFGNDSGQYGLREDVLRDAVNYWRDRFDWRATESAMNALSHFRVEIDDIPIHFVYARSGRSDAIPLVLTHGWPWTFWDWRLMIEPLTNPLPGVGPAFDLVIPSLPGYVFSTPLRTTGIDLSAIAGLWRRLMQDVLGYRRFAAAGGDWGSLISAQLGHSYPDDVIAVHLTLPLVPGVELSRLLEAPFAPEEQWMAERLTESKSTILSHIAVHSADPQTLAYALADSPVGLAAWLWERRLAWSDPRNDSAARDLDSLCVLASLYWLTDSIGSSLRVYWEHFRQPWRGVKRGEQSVTVPTGLAVAPKEIVLASRASVEAMVNLRRWTVLTKGGHFVPVEAPDELTSEYRAFFAEAL